MQVYHHSSQFIYFSGKKEKPAQTVFSIILRTHRKMVREEFGEDVPRTVKEITAHHDANQTFLSFLKKFFYKSNSN